MFENHRLPGHTAGAWDLGQANPWRNGFRLKTRGYHGYREVGLSGPVRALGPWALGTLERWGLEVALFGGKVNKKTSWPACQATVLLCTQDSVSVFGFPVFRFPWLAAMRHGNRPSLSCWLGPFGSEFGRSARAEVDPARRQSSGGG